MIENRHFPAQEDFGAYHECERWLKSEGCSVGSMERGADTAVFFEPDRVVSKNRNLAHARKNVHGWIKSKTGRFRDAPIDFVITSAGAEVLKARAS